MENEQLVAALNAKEVSDLIGEHITAFLDGGPDRETEDIELAQKAGLKVERTIARWAEAREYLLFILPRLNLELKSQRNHNLT
jgi:hypothetical protein